MAVSAEERERRRSEHAAQAARDYPELEELIARAHMLGAKSVDILTGGWEETPLGQTYVAVCHLVTEAGFSTTRRGRARPGDSQAEDARPADQDIFVESRAEARSLRAALRTAFPAADVDATQPAHVKQAQLLVRKAAERLHMTRDELAEVAHRKLGVASLNDVTPEQADEVIAWLEPFVTGDA